MSKVYTLEEVSQHSTKKDLWIVVHNKVYDISNYLEDHPGGGEILVEVAGTDATESFEEVGHSDEARELLKPFLIGELPPDPSRAVVQTYRPEFKVVATESTVGKKSTFRKFLEKFVLRALVIGSIGYIASRGYKRNWNLKDLPRSTDFTQLQKVILPRLNAGGSGFWVGFAISSTLSSSFVLGAVNYINKVLNPHKSFARYPPSRKFKASTYVLKAKKVATPVLDPRTYRRFPLAQKEKLSHDSYRLTFSLPNTNDSIGLPTGQHVSIRTTVDGEKVSRSYTPTSNNTDLGRLELVVKICPNGKVTSFLEKLNINDEVELAGPKGSMKYTKDLCKHIGMVAGGSGITPMYQVIRAVCEDPTDTTTISLIYANKTEDDILLREQLDRFAKKCPEKFKVHYILDTPPAKWAYSKGYVTPELMKERFPAASPDSKIFLCGPPPMLNAMKKNLTGLGFKAPGALSRMSDQIFTF